MPTTPHLRIARPVTDLERSTNLYRRGLDLIVLGSFEDHDGFDGVMLGFADASFHFEFTYCRTHPVAPQPTAEDLLVFYLPETQDWEAACRKLSNAGFERVSSLNPYWEERGRTYQDPDGYRVVLERSRWGSE